jgi:hypothetical protein
MLNRRRFAAAALALLALPTFASAQDAMPSASQIERKLEAAPQAAA